MELYASPDMGEENVFGKLAEDHDQIGDLFADLEGTEDPAERAELFHTLQQRLMLHRRIEEEAFYPAVRRDGAVPQVERALEEHAVVGELLDEIAYIDPADEIFMAKISQLKTAFFHHVHEEEEQLFESARRLLGDDELTQLSSEVNQSRGFLRHKLGDVSLGDTL